MFGNTEKHDTLVVGLFLSNGVLFSAQLGCSYVAVIGFDVTKHIEVTEPATFRQQSHYKKLSVLNDLYLVFVN